MNIFGNVVHEFAKNALLLLLNKIPFHPSLFLITFRFYPTFLSYYDIANSLSPIPDSHT